MNMHHKKMDLIYEDKEILVVNKPSKLLTIATEKEKNRTLYHMASEYVKKQHPKNKIFIVHRLDKDTSGIVIFAKKELVKKKMQDNWQKNAPLREYLAIIEGTLEKKKGTIINYLKENKTLEVFDTKNPHIGKKAVTKYEVLEENKNKSLIKINIETGRKNQIRVALSSINHPILGDNKYHATKNPYDRLALHASKLVMIHPIKKQELTLLSEIPKEWKRDFKKGIQEYEQINTND